MLVPEAETFKAGFDNYELNLDSNVESRLTVFREALCFISIIIRNKIKIKI